MADPSYGTNSMPEDMILGCASRPDRAQARHGKRPVPLRRASFAFGLLCLLASVAHAQDRSDLAGPWHHFLDRCTFAFTDPQGYLSAMSAGTASASTFYIDTPDGQIRWGGTTGTVASDAYSVMDVGNKRLQGCEVIGSLDGTPAMSDAMNAAFLMDVAARPGAVVSGGAMPAAALGANGASGIESNTYRYLVLGVLPDQRLAEIIISPWSFEGHSITIDGR